MDRPFSRRTFGCPCTWRTDVPPDADVRLPAPVPRSVWKGSTEPTIRTAMASGDPFSAWLDDELESLEERFRAYWTRQSLVVVLIAVCDP